MFVVVVLGMMAAVGQIVVEATLVELVQDTATSFVVVVLGMAAVS